MRGVVYKYTSPSGKVYIGQTIVERTRRRMFLAVDKDYSDGCLINNARRKYGPENFTYMVLFEIEGDDRIEVKRTLDYWEKYYIAEYKSNDRRFGYNMNEGGAGNAGCFYSEETRLKMGENSRHRLAIYHPMKGRKHSPESIALMKANTKRKYGKDNPNYGWKPSKELLDRLAEMSRQRTGEKNPFFGKTHSQEFIQKQRDRFSRPVVQLDAKTLEEIRTFPSATKAAIEVLGKRKRVVEICKVCNRYVRPNGVQSVTTGGYRWRWADEEYVHVEAKIPPPPSFKGQHLTQEMKDNISRINSKSVCQLDPNTLEVITIHKSCQVAANALGHPRSNGDIGKMCNGKTTKEKVLGYKWKWLNQ